MKWKLLTILAGFVIFGLPMLALNLGALSNAARFERALSGETDVPEAVENAGKPVLDAWGTFREGREIEALFVPDTFTRRRAIEFEEKVSITDLLREGEPAPPPDFERLWVLARAPQYVRDRECPVVLETFGRACAVSTASAEETDEPGIWTVKAIVGYLPDHDLGPTEVEGPRDLYRARLRLPAGGGIAVRPEGADAAKRTFYTELERACDQLRTDRGNCVLADVSFRAGRANSDGTVPYSVTASLYNVGPQGSGGATQDLVGTYGATLAENRTGIEEKLGLFAALGALFAADQPARSGDGPRIIRGGHTRYGGSDGRFISARER